MPTAGLKPRQQAASPALAARWRNILDLIPVAAYTCDAKGRITYFNSLAEAIWGRAPVLRDSADRYCGSFRLYLSESTPVRHDKCWMALALRNGKKYNGREILIERSDGGRSWGLAHANPLRNGRGRIIGAVNLVVDITAQKVRADRKSPRSMAPMSHGAALAMIDIGISILAGMRWPTATFS